MKELNSQRIISRLDTLINDGYHLLSTIEPRYQDDKARKKNQSRGEFADEFLHLKFTTSSLYFMDMVIGKESIFYTRFNNRTDGIAEEPIKKQISLLEALKTELTDIWYWTAQGLANAEVFTNMLEESEHLLERNFKIPAAVLAGCVLETHLKKLCEKNGVDLYITKSNGDKQPKKAAALNQELAQIDVFNKNDSKEVTNYLGIRNSAAHGNVTEFTDEQVVLMQQGISGIVSRNPI